jgi:hypothetical protein
MNTFQFVTISHPDQIKDKKKQSTIRRHAIKSSLKKNRDNAAERSENFVGLEVSGNGRGLIMNRTRMRKVALVSSPSNARQDPFNTMPGSADRLRVLMGHSEYAYVGLITRSSKM